MERFTRCPPSGSGWTRILGPLLAAVLLAKCGGSPTAPPPPPANSAPVIRSITLSSTQVEAAGEIQATVVVEDAETPPDSLTYVWTSQGGSFNSQTRSVRWKAPSDGPVPGDYTLQVTVVEDYLTRSGNQNVAAQHRVTASSASIRVNDRIREMRQLSETFLSDFADSTKSAEFCVRNFTDSCTGKSDELLDIRNNRLNYTILSSSHTIRSIDFNGWPECTYRVGGVRRPDLCALVVAPSTFFSKDNRTGVADYAIGHAYLTGVFEQNRWWLCDSRWFPPTTTSLRTPFLR